VEVAYLAYEVMVSFTLSASRDRSFTIDTSRDYLSQYHLGHLGTLPCIFPFFQMEVL
jgi:hypothetical protein